MFRDTDPKCVPQARLCACGKKLYWGNKTGKCRPCLNSDQDYHARKAEAIKKAFAYDPTLRIKHVAAVAEINRRPERRKQSGEQAKRIRLWEYGLPNVTPEVRERGGKTLTDRRLEAVPLEHRETYKSLVKKVGAQSALEMVMDHVKTAVKRAHSNQNERSAS